MTATEWRDQAIDELSLFVRPANALRRNGIETVGRLMEMTESDLRRIKNLGVCSIRNIIDSLAVHGLSLAEERQTPANRMADLREEHEHCMQALMLGDDEAKKSVFRMQRLLGHTRRALEELCDRIASETGTEWQDAAKILPSLEQICEVEIRGGTTLRAMLRRLPSGDYAWANGEKNDYRVMQVTRWRGISEGER
jgi:hypothetical protein